MAITSEEYRDALRHFPSGVTVVTIKAGDVIHGLTVSAFASVSPAPPLVAVIIDHRHQAHELLQQDGVSFAVNILRHEDVEISNRFAWLKDEERFQPGVWSTGPTGAPVLPTALAWIDCKLVGRYPAGTHSIYTGEVQASFSATDGNPLIYWNRGYRHLATHD